MKRKEAAQLIDKYRAGQCTPREKRLVENWFNQLLKEESELPFQPDWQRVKETTFEKLPRPSRRLSFRWMSVAASLLVAAAGLLLWPHWRKDQIWRPSQKVVIAPGANRAMLTLANGTTIVLDSNQTGIVVDGGSIRYLAGGSLPIDSSTANLLTLAGMKLSTPIGGQYQIILEDGTKVSLNAASTLSYPRHFSMDKRQVHLEGEGYFEVTDDKKRPFYVITRSQELVVLGTSFGISAYTEDAAVKTTLASGAVQVRPADPTLSEIVLAPGEQSTLSDDGMLSRGKVDVTSEFSWRDGNFSFQSEDIYSVMRKIQRWYDVEVHYEGAPVTERYSGVISRFEDISKVLAMLEKTKTVHFKIEERRVTVMR